MSWTARPVGMEAPGHDYRGAEMEAVLDQIERLSSYPASAQALDTGVTDGTTTSTSFTNSLTTTTTRGVAFTAGDSGKVFVAGSANVRNNTASGYALLDFEVREGSTVGSGNIVRPSDENSCGLFQSDSASQQGPAVIVPTLVTGLVAGNLYNAVLTYRTLANIATYNRRKISVQYTV